MKERTGSRTRLAALWLVMLCLWTPFAGCAAQETQTEGKEGEAVNAEAFYVTVGQTTLTATFEENAGARALKALLAEGDLTLDMHDYGDFEKVGELGTELPTEDERMTTQPGDVLLYQGRSLTIYYDENTWSFTRLGRIENATRETLLAALGEGDAVVTLSLHSQAHAFALEESGLNGHAPTLVLNSGYEMPIVGLGTYSLLDDVCVSSVVSALRQGFRMIDTAYMYHNEAAVGEGIRQSGVPREEIFVITKLYPSQYGDAAAAIDQALERLGLDYIDMLLLHHPGEGDVEAYRAMERAAEAGKIRSLGLSNWYVEEMEAFLPQISVAPALVQNEIHPYYQENDVIPYMQERGIAVQAWYPLGGRGYTAELLGDETIAAIAKAHGKSAAQVILRWDLQKGVVVIPGSSNPDHILENISLFDFALTDDEMARINALDRGEKHDWY